MTGLEYGDGTVARENEILRSTVGSEVHGIHVPGTEDHDEMGVYIEPPSYLFRVAGFPFGKDERYRDNYIWRTKPEGVRSGHGDTDLVLYSLRRYLDLAVKGNPTVLLLLFAPSSSLLVHAPLGDELRSLRDEFLSESAVHRFLGYMHSQWERMVGQSNRHTPNRPELIEKYGFDCYLDDTEFLTRQGWLTYDEIGDGEEVATIAADGTVEFQSPVERVAKPYSGPIIVGQSRYSSWAVTPNHRMWVSKIERGPSGVFGESYVQSRANWQFKRADEIRSLLWHQRVAGAPRMEEYPVTDAHLALVGAYVAEGCPAKRLKNGDVSVLAMEQKDGGRLHDVMDLVATEYQLRRYRYPKKRPVTKFTLADREVAREITETCGIGEHNKRLPRWAFDLSSRQAEVLLWALLAGDGTPYKTGGWIYYTISPRLAGDVQALAMMAGRRTSQWGPYEPASMYQVFIADADPNREVEGFHPRRHMQEVMVENRRIVCFTVPNERLVTRRNGRVTMHGNTKFAAHALRLAYQGLEIAATGHLTLPLPLDQRHRVLDVKGGQIPMEEVSEEILEIKARIETMLADGSVPLPPLANAAAITQWSTAAHLRHWNQRGLI